MLSCGELTFPLIPLLAIIFAVFQDGFYVQKLVSPVTETGSKMTLKDLFELFSTEKSKGEGRVVYLSVFPGLIHVLLLQHLV